MILPDQTVYQTWAKSNNPPQSYWLFSKFSQFFHTPL